MSSKITLEFSPQQVAKLVDKLSLEDKIILTRKLESQTWPTRLDNVVSRVRKNFKKYPVSDKEIAKICEETRQKLYNERNKSRH